MTYITIATTAFGETGLQSALCMLIAVCYVIDTCPELPEVYPAFSCIHPADGNLFRILCMNDFRDFFSTFSVHEFVLKWLAQ